QPRVRSLADAHGHPRRSGAGAASSRRHTGAATARADPMNDEWEALRAFTPARVALGRAGNGLPTSRVLEFQLAHARARDAVLRPFDAQGVITALTRPGSQLLMTQATDRQRYLMSPDAGRSLSEASRRSLV